MRFYVLVEGDTTEKKIYSAWLQHLFPGLRIARQLDGMPEDSALIVKGGGYPSYLRRIEAALKDIESVAAAAPITALFVCIDAEEYTLEERLAEVEALVAGCEARCHVIVQDPCIEAWFLGHEKLPRRNPQSAALRALYEFYDVVLLDPERMPCAPDFVTRAQTHLHYFRLVCQERGISYSKHNPEVCEAASFLDALRARYENTEHLQSFGRFLSACAVEAAS